MKQTRVKRILKDLKLNENTVSRILGILAVVVVIVLIFNYFGARKEETTPPEFSTEEIATEETPVNLVEEEGKLFPEDLPKEYLVQEGDNLWKIAEKFYSSGYNWVDIAKENNLSNPNIVEAGQKINLPKAEVKKPTVETELTKKDEEPILMDSYQVQKGDSLWKIALRAYGDGYQWAKIAQANSLVNPNLIHPGNNLSIPR